MIDLEQVKKRVEELEYDLTVAQARLDNSRQFVESLQREKTHP